MVPREYDALKPYLAPMRYVNYLEDDESGDPAAARVRAELRAPAGAQGQNTNPDNFFHVKREHPASLTGKGADPAKEAP